MVRAVILLLVVLIAAVYGAMFLSWNQAWVSVTSFYWPAQGQAYVQDLPLGYLVLGAVLLGALLMALFVGIASAGQRATARRYRTQVGVAKKKLEEAAARLKQQRERISELEAKLAAAAPEAAPPATTPPEPEVELDLEAPEDDGEII